MRRFILGLLLAGVFVIGPVGCGGGSAKTVPAPEVQGGTGDAPKSEDEPTLSEEGP